MLVTSCRYRMWHQEAGSWLICGSTIVMNRVVAAAPSASSSFVCRIMLENSIQLPGPLFCQPGQTMHFVNTCM